MWESEASEVLCLQKRLESHLEDPRAEYVCRHACMYGMSLHGVLGGVVQQCLGDLCL